MMDSLYNASTPPHLRHHHRTLSSRVPYCLAHNTTAAATSPSAPMHSLDCREDEDSLMFQLDLEDDKLTSAKPASLTAWSHYTSRLPSYTATAPPLRPATASPSLCRTTPLPCPPSAKQPMKYGSAQQPQRASLSPTIPTLSSRMRSLAGSTPSTRTAVPSPSARLIKALPLSPAASATSSSSCVSQCSTASDDDDYPSLDYTQSPSIPSPASPIAVLTSTPAAAVSRSSSSIPFLLSPLPQPPALPRAYTSPTSKAQQWRSEKGVSVQAGDEVKRLSLSTNRPQDEADISTYIFELEL